jgi:hypothetical protein
MREKPIQKGTQVELELNSTRDSTELNPTRY